MKTSKFWSTLALVASVLIVLSMAAILYGYLNKQFSFRDASGYLRTAAQISVFILGYCVVVALLSWKNKASMIKALVAVAIIVTPLMVMKNNMPAGTSLFASAPAGPPPGAGGNGAGGNSRSDPSKAPINDISTDTVNPPEFSAVIPLRPEKSTAIEYAGESAAAAQAAQFPDIKPIDTTLSTTDAFNRALELVNDEGWEVVAEDASTGIIEAVSSTRFFNFQDDVIVRVSENGTGSLVDIRSHSRVGRNDRGKNAERVRAFISSF